MLSDGGDSLSGGQKIRTTIARALYQDTDIYLMDDPLSALDGEVASFLMKKTIKELLANKTRVVVTHASHLLKYADRLIIMDKGEFKYVGSY